MRRALRFSAFGLLLGALASCSLFDYSNIVVHKFALVYGVTIYTNAFGVATGPNLQFPDADASAMAALLSAQGYTVQSRWVNALGHAITTGNVDHGLVGSLSTSTTDGSTSVGGTAADAFAPSKSNILADISALSSTIGQNDVIVVYFSGHGTQDPSTTPPREYFDPYGSVMQYIPDGKYYDFPVPSVRDDELRTAFEAIKTPRKVLILDTCNSGGFVGNQLEVDWTPPAAANGVAFVSPATLFAAIAAYLNMQSSPTGLSPYGDAQVLAAAGRDESSYETSSYGHGVMTYWLLQGLQGSTADLNHDGYVSVLEAFAYAKAGVEKNWNAVQGSTYAFEPHVSGGPVDFVLF
jgi:hypothetical protein